MTADPSAQPAAQDPDEAEVVRLQQIIRDKRTALDAAKPGTPGYQPALDAVLLATVELVNHEARIPVRRRETYSARTAQIVRRAGLITAASAALVTLLTLTPWVSAWWLLLLVPLLAAAGAVTATARGAPPSDRSTRRDLAYMLVGVAAVDLALVVASRWLPYWLTTIVVAMATTGCLIATWHLTGHVDESATTNADSG